MAADPKKTTIVIKKINVIAGGAHGGSWKVAFADFMTAMMCFFLVMWLLNQPEEVKKQVARYFSGPSVIEQHFSIYGAELTLEKLFLDLVNEPLKGFQMFVQPADITPDIMSLGSKKAALYHVAQQMGEVASNVKVTEDEISFEIPDHFLFERGTAQPINKFTEVMENLKELTTGLENSNVFLESLIYSESVPGKNSGQAEVVASNRLDLIKNLVETSFEHPSNEVKPKVSVDEHPLKPNMPAGMLKITIKQKELLPNGLKPRPLRGDLGEKKSDTSVYNEFVRRMTGSEKRERARLNRR